MLHPLFCRLSEWLTEHFGWTWRSMVTLEWVGETEFGGCYRYIWVCLVCGRIAR